MEFSRVKQFVHEEFLKKKSKYKDEFELTITSYNFSKEQQIISCGLSNGCIVQFVCKNFDQPVLTLKKEYDIVEFFEDKKNCHKGEITCITLANIFEQNYCITGSVDRTIKVWETNPKKRSIVQTLVGHQGTIMDLAYSQKQDTLFTVSNDKTIKIWRQEEGRELLFHPWFNCCQIIFDFTMKKQIGSQNYVTTLHVRDGDLLRIYAGDTEGVIHIIKPENDKKGHDFVIIDKSNRSFHRIHVQKIITIHKDNQIYSIGFDQTIIGYEENSQKQFFTMKNPHKCNFTSLSWNHQYGELIASDESGRVYFINMHTDKSIQEFSLYDKVKIQGVEIIERIMPSITSKEKHAKDSQLIIFTNQFIDVLRIKRGVKAGNLLEAHTGPIIGLYSLVPAKLLKNCSEPPSLISASLDNSIRVWDTKDSQMTCQNILENADKSEISCLSYLKQANLFVTGHDNGEIKLWNIELNNCLTLEQHLPHKHLNTICCFASYVHEDNKMQNKETTEYLFSAGYDGKINIWEIFEKKSIVQSSLMSSTICPQLKQSILVNQETKQTDQIGHEILALLIDNKHSQCIIAGGNSTKLIFINRKNIEQIEFVSGHTDSINCLCIEEKILFSGSDDKTIRLWNVQTREALAEIFNAHEEPIRDLLIIEETGHLVSCAYDGKVNLWDYPKQELIKTFEKNESIRCMIYMFEQKMVLEEIKEDEDEDQSYKKPIKKKGSSTQNTRKVNKKDIKLFIGTDENNIYTFQLDQWIDTRSDNYNYEDNVLNIIENNHKDTYKYDSPEKKKDKNPEDIDIDELNKIIEQQQKQLAEFVNSSQKL